MYYDYRRRGYLLPEGCKDLIDVIDAIHPTTAIMGSNYVVTVRMPGLKSQNVEVSAEGTALHISVRRTGSPVASAKTIEVPGHYAPDKARAMYLNGQLRIIVPPK